MSQSKSQTKLGAGTPEEQAEPEDPTDENQASLFQAGEGGSSVPEHEEQPDTEAQGSRGRNGGKDSGTENLEEFGVEEDHSPNTPRLDNPDGELEEDRRTNRSTGEDTTEQEQLFPDVDDENQLTLGGEKAYNQCKFE